MASQVLADTMTQLTESGVFEPTGMPLRNDRFS